jgi:hypothetical protein
MEQIFDVSEREWEPNIEHHREADDLRACFEIAERRAIGHLVRLNAHGYASQAEFL